MGARTDRWIVRTVFILLLVLPEFVAAQRYAITIDLVVDPIIYMICLIYLVFSRVAAMIAGVVFVGAGIKWILSQEDIEARKQARDIMKNAIMGLIIVIVTAAVIATVSPIFEFDCEEMIYGWQPVCLCSSCDMNSTHDCGIDTCESQCGTNCHWNYTSTSCDLGPAILLPQCNCTDCSDPASGGACQYEACLTCNQSSECVWNGATCSYALCNDSDGGLNFDQSGVCRDPAGYHTDHCGPPPAGTPDYWIQEWYCHPTQGKCVTLGFANCLDPVQVGDTFTGCSAGECIGGSGATTTTIAQVDCSDAECTISNSEWDLHWCLPPGGVGGNKCEGYEYNVSGNQTHKRVAYYPAGDVWCNDNVAPGTLCCCGCDNAPDC